ncbi:MULTISPECIES: TetR/AcrR family transcriptional regulator [Gracilibacillus]|uniref:TetR/AcrR family transcriptional regulator n=1 Tax=Gracilibacillus TaxID=74385 RepID=UPI000825E103|nr:MULTISPECIES: TetR/AcrR family transcriptional regulator [Gracilibacillus]
MTQEQSFIGAARREQIIKAAIEVLNEIGYVKVSLAKIAKQAKISTGLISYHFSDKEDVLNQTLMYVVTTQIHYINEKVEAEEGPYQKLLAFIQASLTYQTEYYKYNVAMLEIIFNGRTADNIPYYKLAGDDEDALYLQLEEILVQGQTEGIFSSAIQPKTAAILINGAISESLLLQNDSFDMASYQEELVVLVTRMVKE